MAKNNNIETQLKILATNLEVLNQKIIKNPEDILSPGEKLIEERLEELEKKVNHLTDLLKSTEIWNSLDKQKESIEHQVGQIERVVDNLQKVDKPWINESLQKISEVNASAIETAENTRKLYMKFDEKAEEHKKAYFRGLNFKFKRLDQNLQLRLLIFLGLISMIIAVEFIVAFLLIS